MHQCCGPSPQEATHEIVGGRSGGWGGIVQVDDEDIHDVIACRDGQADEEEEGDWKVDGDVLLEEPAIDGYAEGADVLFHDRFWIGVSLFLVKKQLPTRAAGAEGGGKKMGREIV